MVSTAVAVLDPMPTKTSDEKLLDLTNKTKYSLVQRNGQRIYGGPPPDWNGAAPPEKGCEIFVGKVPRDCYEDELVPIFATVSQAFKKVFFYCQTFPHRENLQMPHFLSFAAL